MKEFNGLSFEFAKDLREPVNREVELKRLTPDKIDNIEDFIKNIDSYTESELFNIINHNFHTISNEIFYDESNRISLELTTHKLFMKLFCESVKSMISTGIVLSKPHNVTIRTTKTVHREISELFYNVVDSNKKLFLYPLLAEPVVSTIKEIDRERIQLLYTLGIFGRNYEAEKFCILISHSSPKNILDELLKYPSAKKIFNSNNKFYSILLRLIQLDTEYILHDSILEFKRMINTLSYEYCTLIFDIMENELSNQNIKQYLSYIPRNDLFYNFIRANHTRWTRLNMFLNS